MSSSVLTIAVLSADRLLAVRRPLSLSVYRASRYTWIIVAGVWTASLAVAAPLLDVRRLRVVNLGFGPHETFTFCHEASRCTPPVQFVLVITARRHASAVYAVVECLRVCDARVRQHMPVLCQNGYTQHHASNTTR